MPFGHLLGKCWPLGSRLWCLIVTLSLSPWYPGSGAVLDCIDSWSLTSFLLCWKRSVTTLTQPLAFLNCSKRFFVCVLLFLPGGSFWAICTDLPAKSDSDFMFVYKVIRDLRSIDHLCIVPIHRIGLIHKWSINSRQLKWSVRIQVLLNNCKQRITLGWHDSSTDRCLHTVYDMRSMRLFISLLVSKMHCIRLIESRTIQIVEQYCWQQLVDIIFVINWRIFVPIAL